MALYPSNQLPDSHHKDKTVSWPFYPFDGNPHALKDSLYIEAGPSEPLPEPTITKIWDATCQPLKWYFTRCETSKNICRTCHLKGKSPAHACWSQSLSSVICNLATYSCCHTCLNAARSHTKPVLASGQRASEFSVYWSSTVLFWQYY